MTTMPSTVPQLARFSALGAAIGAFLGVHMYSMPALNGIFSGPSFINLAERPEGQALSVFNAIVSALFYTAPLVVLMSLVGLLLLLACGALSRVGRRVRARRLLLSSVAGFLAGLGLLALGLSAVFWAIDALVLTATITYLAYSWLHAPRTTPRVTSDNADSVP